MKSHKFAIKRLYFAMGPIFPTLPVCPQTVDDTSLFDETFEVIVVTVVVKLNWLQFSS